MPKTSELAGFKYDFFISRRGSAADNAREMASVLTGAGYRVLVQDLHMPVSVNFVGTIHDGIKEAANFIVLLTKDYDVSFFTRAEWTSFFVTMASSEGKRRLITFRVEDVEAPGLLAPYVFGDLFNVKGEARRRQIILSAAEGRSDVKEPETSLYHEMPARNPDFMGRDKLLEQLHRSLMGPERSATRAPVALHGLGGAGKTSIAAEYAHRYAERYANVWWAPAENRAVLLESLAKLGRKLDEARSGHDGTDRRVETEVLARLALAQLAASGAPWLLIYDNVTRARDIRDWIPNGGTRLLITTRVATWNKLAEPFDVEMLKPIDATRLLLKLANRTDRPGAIRLARVLGNLPLALDQAAAFVKLTGMTFDQYAESAAELMAEAPDDSERTVAATFTMAIDQAVAECPGAATLLSFLSMLAAEPIPPDLLDDSILPASELRKAVMALAMVSLLHHETLDDGSPAISVHPLVQAAMRQRLRERGEFESALKKATARLAAAYPNKSYSDPGTWSRCQVLFPHALALRDEARRAKIETVELALLLNGAGNYMLGRSALAEGEPLLKEAVEIASRVLGQVETRVGAWTNDYGNLLLNSGRFDEARDIYLKAVAIGVNTLGGQNPNVAVRRGNLAYALMKLGRYAEAEKHFVEAIKKVQAAWGRKHRHMASLTHKLGYLYMLTGRYPDAERLLREATAIIKPKANQKDKDIAATILVCDWNCDLAQVMWKTGRIKEGEKLYRQSLAVLGDAASEHSSVSFAHAGLADLLLGAGRLEEAQQEATRAVEAQTKLFGLHHRWTRESSKLLNRITVARNKAQPKVKRVKAALV